MSSTRTARAHPISVTPSETADARSDKTIDAAIEAARHALTQLQAADGHWCFELEADCTIPAEYILMMHFMDELDPALERRLAKYLRARQVLAVGADGGHGGWPLYERGALDLSCTIKCYYALKLAGDDIGAPHMVRAREAILARGGAAKANVFTRIALALFGQLPWRGVPFIPVEIMLLPRWFPFHLGKVSYWSRTVMVPLFVLCTLKPVAKNPKRVSIRELFVTPPEEEQHYFDNPGALNRVFLALDRAGRAIEPLIPRRMRRFAMRKAETWFVERLNGDNGLGAIFPAMVNAYEALSLLGYEKNHPLRVTALKSIQKLLVDRPDGSSYCQPCVSPIWDTGWAALALLATGANADDPAVRKSLDWMISKQELTHRGDWKARAPKLAPGGWAFQYANPDFPDLDDTAMVAAVLHVAARSEADRAAFHEPITRAADWLLGLQSKNGGFASFDADNTYHYLNKIPFADHGALLDPPTEDVSGRVLALLGLLKREQDQPAIRRCLDYLKRTQQADGSWWGRWGTNFVYGTWSVLAGLIFVGEDPQAPYIRKASAWLKARQNTDGGWGESNDSYLTSSPAEARHESTAYTTAWALLALMMVGETQSDSVRHGVDWLLAQQHRDGALAGLWQHPTYTAPGFPRVFYLKYHGYTAYFPLWALARYRQLQQHAQS